MVERERLELLRGRSYAETLSDTFAFVRLNLAVLLKANFLIALPFILGFAAIYVLAFRDYFSLVTSIESGPFVTALSVEEQFDELLVYWTFQFLAAAPVSIVTLIVVHLYAGSGGEPVTVAAVWNVFRKRFLAIFIAKLIMMPFIVLPGFILFAPGVAFYTLFLVVEMLMLQHQYPVFRAIQRSARLMTQNFWTAFGVSATMLGLYVVISLMMAVPLNLLELSEQIGIDFSDRESAWGIAMIAFRGFITIAGYLLFLVPATAVGIQYFSLKERMARSGIMQRIRMIGQAEAKEDIYLEDEQY